jgi:lambda family phage tail tape measure protein
MANMIARLGVALGLDTAEFNKGIESAGKKLEQFSQAAEKYGKIAAVGLVTASAAAIKYADDLADVAEANEVAIGTVLQLSNALANSGGKADNAGKMLSAFAKFIDEAAGGSEQAQKTAKELGVSLQDLGKLSQEELLNKLVANLAQVEDPITRNAKAMEIFSKAAKGVDMVGFAEKIAEANPLIEEQEKAIKAAADTYDLLAQTSRDVMLVLATELGPILKNTVDYFKSLSDSGVSLSAIFKTVFQTVAVLGSEIQWFFSTIFNELAHTYQNAKTLVTEGVDAAIAANEKYNASVKASRQNLDFYQGQVMGVSMGRGGTDERRTDNKKPDSLGRTVTDAGDKERKRLAEAAAKDAKRLAEANERARQKEINDLNRDAQRYAKILFEIEGQEVAAYTNAAKRVEVEQRQLEIKNQLLIIDQQTLGMRSEDAQLAKDLYISEQKRLEIIQEINRNNLLDADAKQVLIERQNLLADATEQYLYAQNQAVKAQRQGTSEEGFTKQAQRFLRDMPTELEQGARAFDSLMGNMESAIDRFVRTGKLSFKDLARSIIQDIIAMQMKAAAVRFLSSLFGGGPTPYQPAAVTGMPAYADGGNPAVGQLSIVGERGPELFVPRTAGTIIPNHALSGMGGTTNVTNNYINAIDTKSFEERLYGSSNAIWAANQYANKSLAVNRGRA